VKKEKYSSTEILKGIRNGDHIILRYVYNQYYKSIRNMVLKKNGSEDLANDVFQEALVVIYKKSQDKNFQIDQSSFFTYLYAVSKVTLLSIHNKNTKDVLNRTEEIDEDREILEDLSEEKHLAMEGLKEHLLHKYLKKISKNCFDILKLVMDGLKSELIAEQLKMSSAAYVRKKKRICLKNLVEMIKKDPKSNELL